MLRPLSGEDRSLIDNLYGCAERMALIGPVMSPEQRARLMAERLKPWQPSNSHWRCWVIDVEGGAGIVGLRTLPMSRATAEVGFMLLKAYEGRGLASQALGLLVQRAFGELEFERLVALCVPQNRGSVTVLRRQGFVLEHRFEAAVPFDDGLRDGVLYALER
ncbi:GNAT family N-acetyltransferase [Ferrimonas balearica]|uniref:GNAT family N-acetyltransferase n=1 Tax=Ferrimonas balearica TaxID=44012 RepID=UPI001C993E8D|nr:GNAT family N-acetyltransferase [Ferrimonas balearica]MBY5991842.1 GNAT family N-acetyltransferase [Ferrimonas balearica]